MSEELRRLGEIFKEKREGQNLSLKEVENATSIRSNYLEAIEEGTIAGQVSGVYAQGFIRQYGSFLGIDIERLIRENPLAFRMPGEKHDFAYGIGTLEARGSASGGVKWLPNLLWASVAALVLVVAWFLAKFLGVIG